MMRFLTSSPTALETEIELALRKNEPAIIHRENAADWVIMSSEMYDNLIEAVFLLKNPASTIHLKQSAARPLANQRKRNSANWDDFFTAQKAAAAAGELDDFSIRHNDDTASSLRDPFAGWQE
ncbi:hypothetical protein ACF3OJ_10800 [Cardiobacterium hominis]|uniref:hypothetical protein n=1 Tax=Cardiobacterium hominis TaxID=2718 RepID=UPI0009A7A638|nr:hypothetical protein [Cardiobacterium hominis]